MAVLICDLDGTIFKWGTEEFLPGAAEQLGAWLRAGHQIIFTTQRAPDKDFEYKLKCWCSNAPDGLYPGQIHVLFDIYSPRIVVNDQGAHAINHKRDAPFEHNLSDAIEVAEALGMIAQSK